jgi:hypothetical protein
MKSATANARARFKPLLKAMRLLPVARYFAALLAASPDYRKNERRFRHLKHRYGPILAARLNNRQDREKVALVCGPGFPEAQIELGLLKGLQLANFMPVVLVLDKGREGRLLTQFYNLAGVESVHQWDAFASEIDIPGAESVVAKCGSMWDLLDFEHAGVRVGKLAVSSALRNTYRGFLELKDTEDRQRLVLAVANGIAAANAAQKILQQFGPELVLFVDNSYSPFGEMFECTIHSNIDAVQWQQSHKSNALVFKRYTVENWLEHPSSLSPRSWQLVRNMEWTEDRSKELDKELYSTYASGDWYSVAGMQFEKAMLDPAKLRERLGLDPNKKTAFIFPHILWDAALFWGECLFSDFEEWLVETVRAACANDGVNWVIKVHPANQRLREIGSLRIEPAEVVALRQHIGDIPPHIRMIPADSDISSYCLFQAMDYCVTVRGTVGMEAARKGIPVLTGGTGPYDQKGFTVDSNSREQYLEKLRNIQSISRLSPHQQELAERFAYANFLMRTWHVESVTLRYLPDAKEFLTEGEINIKSEEGWYTAADLRSFAAWISDPNKSKEFLERSGEECLVSS